MIIWFSEGKSITCKSGHVIRSWITLSKLKHHKHDITIEMDLSELLQMQKQLNNMIKDYENEDTN